MESAPSDGPTVRSSRHFDTRRQRAGAQIQRQVGGFLMTATIPSITPLSLILPLNHGSAEHQLVQHDGQPVADVGAVNRSNRLAASWVSTKSVSQPPFCADLLRTRVAQIAAGYHRRPRQQPILRRRSACVRALA